MAKHQEELEALRASSKSIEERARQAKLALTQAKEAMGKKEKELEESQAHLEAANQKVKDAKARAIHAEKDLFNLKLDLDFAVEKASRASKRAEATEKKLAQKEYLRASSDAKLVRLQKVYNDLLKFAEGYAAHTLANFRKSADFQMEVAKGCSDAYTQG